MPNVVPENFTIADLRGRNFASVSEAAAILGVDPRTVRADIAAGNIPATRTGTYYKVPVAWLRERALAS
jgi:excisionase family DNA binding protein